MTWWEMPVGGGRGRDEGCRGRGWQGAEVFGVRHWSHF